MIAQQARALGRSQASIMVLIGLILAYLLASVAFSRRGPVDLLWITGFRYWLTVLLAAGTFYLCGWLYGGWAGQLILLKHYNPWWTGALLGLLMLLTTVFLVSWVAFFQEALPLRTGFTDAFEDYIVKPVVWVMAAGWRPAVLAGLCFGYKLKP